MRICWLDFHLKLYNSRALQKFTSFSIQLIYFILLLDLFMRMDELVNVLEALASIEFSLTA